MSYKIDKNKLIILDMQFVVGNNHQLFVKELAYKTSNDINHHYFCFKSPFSHSELTENAKKQNDYNYKYINGLNWNHGYIPYTQLQEILINLKDHIILVVGEAKKIFLEKFNFFINPILDIDLQKSLLKLENFKTNCNYHKSNNNPRCAINNIHKIYLFLEQNDYLINTKY